MTGVYRMIVNATVHPSLASRLLGAGLLATLVIGGAAPARAEGPGTGEVTAVSLAPAAGKAELVIAVKGAVDVRDFLLTSPDRLVLDVVGAKLSDAAPAAVRRVVRGGVLNLRYSQFRPDIVRIVVDLDGPKAYEVKRQGDVHQGLLRRRPEVQGLDVDRGACRAGRRGRRPRGQDARGRRAVPGPRHAWSAAAWTSPGSR